MAGRSLPSAILPRLDHSRQTHRPRPRTLFPAAATLLLALLATPTTGQTGGERLKTPGEASRYTRYSQAEEIGRFLSRLDALSDRLVLEVAGRTRETEELPARDLLLAILTANGADSPATLDRGKPTLFFFASQHGNEQSAKEAALRLVRDAALGELDRLLERINLLVIPQANPYGNRFDRRRNEQDLDPNRDHVKLESATVRTIHRVFRRFMPEVTVDVHEKGDDYYRVSIGCVSNANIAAELQELARSIVLAEVEKNLDERGIPFHEYLVNQPMGIDSSAGAANRSADDDERPIMTRFSTTDLNDGRNSLGIYETLSFIQEGASRRDLRTLAERTEWQYWGLRFLAESVARHAAEITTLVRGRRQELLERAAAVHADDLIHLRMRYARDERQPTLTLRRFDDVGEAPLAVLKSDRPAGALLFSGDLESPPEPDSRRVAERTIENWFPGVEPTLSVLRPLGYLVPAAHHEVIETLLQHDIELELITEDGLQAAEAYRVREIEPDRFDYLPPKRIEVEARPIEAVVKAGDVYVPCQQPAANLIPNLLEPQAQYGFIRYWKLDLVPEAGSLFPFLRVVEPPDLERIPYRPWPRR